MIEEALETFLLCLREQRYYDAHEVLEACWFPRRFEDDDEVRLLKGFINASVSFELVKRGRLTPSKRVWKNYLKYRPLIETIGGERTLTYRRVANQIERIHVALPIAFL